MNLIAISELLAERGGRLFDNPFQKELQDLIILYRARYIANRIEKKKFTRLGYTQSFLVPIVEVNREECQELPECLCEAAFKTTKKIPLPITDGTTLFDYVGAPGGFKSFGWTTFGNEILLRNSPITGKFPRYAYVNQYIYAFNAPNDENLRIEGVFGDPRLLSEFTCDGSTPCYTSSSDFPVDEQMLQLIIKGISTEILKIEEREPAIDKIDIKTDGAT